VEIEMNHKFSGMFLFGVCCTMIVGSLALQSKLNDLRDAQAKPNRSPTRWLCKEPRELALGSGAVKECEWSY